MIEAELLIRCFSIPGLNLPVFRIKFALWGHWAVYNASYSSQRPGEARFRTFQCALATSELLYRYTGEMHAFWPCKNFTGRNAFSPVLYSHLTSNSYFFRRNLTFNRMGPHFIAYGLLGYLGPRIIFPLFLPHIREASYKGNFVQF